MLGNSKTWFGLSASLALGCGGNTVDMGQRGDGSGFVDAPSGVAVANPTVPQTVYEGDPLVYGFTADETTLYALVATADDLGELVSCPLDRCQSERTVLTQGIVAIDTSPNATPMWLVGDWIVWTYGRGSPAEGVAACRKTGCDAPLRAVSANRSALTGDGDSVYWIDLDGWLNRWKPEDSTAERLREVKEVSGAAVRSVALAGKYFYFTDLSYSTGRVAISRVRKDGSEAVEVVARGDHVSSIAIAGDSLYYAAQLLGGFIASCPLSGSEGSDQALVSNQRWPFALQIAETEAFWLAKVGAEHPETSQQPGALLSCRLPECSAVKSWVSGFYLPGHYDEDDDMSQRFVMTSQFVLWREGLQGLRNAIRRLPR